MIAQLLAWVRERGIDWVPEPLPGGGVSWIDGAVPDDPMPEWVWTDDVLKSIGQRLRALHDATVGFPGRGPWMLAAREPAEVICHNDFAPYNLVFRGGELIGAIDFEACAPGPRAWDLAYAAYRSVPLCAPSNTDLPFLGAAEQRRRLELMCAEYGIEVATVLALVPERLEVMAEMSPPADAALYRADAAYMQVW